MKKLLQLAAAFAYLISLTASAAFIVDTGPGPNVSAGSLLSTTQSLAGQFTISDNYKLQSIEGWITISEANTFGTIAVYTDDSGSPGTEIYSATFEGVDQIAQWIGVTGLSWNLTANTYWVTFEVRAGQTLDAAMPWPVASPLTNYAFTRDGAWVDRDTLNFGVRIIAEPTTENVTIAIKPKKRTNSIISLKHDKNLRVAINGSESFDALQVDPVSVKFGPNQAEPVRYKGQDYNRDGYSDLILTFKLNETGITCGHTDAILTGYTFSDPVTNITGSDSFTVEPCPQVTTTTTTTITTTTSSQATTTTTTLLP